MRGPDRNRKPGRRAPFRDPRPTILIVCEGEKTERQYFEQFAAYHKNARVKVKVADETGVPLSLVEAAKEYKKQSLEDARREQDSYLAYDSIWCVFDVDQHPHIPEARDMANANGIELAVSNPCFELWLVLHFRDAPGMTHRHQMQAMLKKHHDGYHKHVNYDFYAQGYPLAVARAEKLDLLADQVGEPGRNPTTGAYKLTKIILKDNQTG